MYMESLYIGRGYLYRGVGVVGGGVQGTTCSGYEALDRQGIFPGTIFA